MVYCGGMLTPPVNQTQQGGVLRDRLTTEERRRGLRRATDLYGDVTDSEILQVKETKHG